ncbi:MAG: hypothetical protein Q4C96_10980 [Planctomycetia bacterium]|nr:hypothetical protein [Planctomycetia bacterium]
MHDKFSFFGIFVLLKMSDFGAAKKEFKVETEYNEAKISGGQSVEGKRKFIVHRA